MDKSRLILGLVGFFPRYILTVRNGCQIQSELNYLLKSRHGSEFTVRYHNGNQESYAEGRNYKAKNVPDELLKYNSMYIEKVYLLLTGTSCKEIDNVGEVLDDVLIKSLEQFCTLQYFGALMNWMIPEATIMGPLEQMFVGPSFSLDSSAEIFCSAVLGGMGPSVLDDDKKQVQSILNNLPKSRISDLMPVGSEYSKVKVVPTRSHQGFLQQPEFPKWDMGK
ncbi:hypothetical protein Tco_1344335 [Tanacetum coccineum]